MLSAKKVSLVSAHGKKQLKFYDDLRLIDVLHLNQIPWSAVSCYINSRNGNLRLHSNLSSKISEIPDDQVVFMYQRNIDPLMYQQNEYTESHIDDCVASYFYQKVTSTEVSETFLKGLTEDDCKFVVRSNVHEFLRSQFSPANNKVVVGVSGGGDSNALLHGLCSFEDFEMEIFPVIIKGLPEWNLGVDRARELCKLYGLDLKVIEEDEVKRVLNIPQDKKTLLDRFESVFKKDDFEVLASLLIRLSIESYAKELGIENTMIGANMDDKLAEAIFSFVNNDKFLPIPSRKIGRFTIHYPLWKVPKVIIDGCFPKYSKENYETRYPSFSPGRTLYYQMAYSIISQFQGIPERILDTVSKRAEQTDFFFDHDLGFHVLEHVPIDTKHKFLKMLRTQ